jgi:chromosome segregation ATPase
LSSAITKSIDQVSAEIARLDADIRATRARIRALQAPVAGRTESQRSEVHAAIRKEGEMLFELEQTHERCKSTLSKREADLQKAEAASVDANSLQEAIDDAERRVAELQAKRPALVDSLAAASNKQAEVEQLNADEQAAASKLEQLRADVFLASPGSFERDELDESIGEADMALSIAKEKAATGRAALPRIVAAVEQRTADLEALDAEISRAEGTLGQRTRERDMWEAFVSYEVAQVALGEAALRIKELDRDKGDALLEVLRRQGVRRFDELHVMQVPEWLKNPNIPGGCV